MAQKGISNRPRKSKTKLPKKNSAPIPIRALDFIMYCAQDLPKTRAFYQGLFGLKRGGEWSNFWSEFDTAPITFCLNGTSQRPNRNWQGPPAIAFAVQDINAAVNECRRRKVKILMEPVETTVCWMAFIADPAGNRICLHQRKDGTAG